MEKGKHNRSQLRHLLSFNDIISLKYIEMTILYSPAREKGIEEELGGKMKEKRERERKGERRGLAMIVAMSAPLPRAGNNNRPSYRPCTPVIAVITASGLYRLSMQIAANYI